MKYLLGIVLRVFFGALSAGQSCDEVGAVIKSAALLCGAGFLAEVRIVPKDSDIEPTSPLFCLVCRGGLEM